MVQCSLVGTCRALEVGAIGGKDSSDDHSNRQTEPRSATRQGVTTDTERQPEYMYNINCIGHHKNGAMLSDHPVVLVAIPS